MLGAISTNGPRTWWFVLQVFGFLYSGASLRGRRLISMGYHLTCMHVWLSRTAARTPSVPILLDGFAWPRLTNWLRHRPATELAGAQLRRTLELFYPRVLLANSLLESLLALFHARLTRGCLCYADYWHAASCRLFLSRP